jgi:PIN domain nuclease of toxin-antitoxin system
LNLLLDTHVLIWWLADHHRLTKKVRKSIEEADAVWVSAVTGWEIEVKRARGLLEAPEDLEGALRLNHFKALPLRFAHAVLAARLPSIHRDPFGRMLVAQAKHEGLTLATVDRELAKYGVPVIAG